MDQIVRKFSIENLFGCQDVLLSIDERQLILIGENGSGKTTVMNIFYHMLKGDFSKIEKYDFDRVSLVFVSGEEVSFTKYDLERLNELKDTRASLSPAQIKRRLGPVFKNSDEFKLVLTEIENNEISVSDVEGGVLVDRLGFGDHKFKSQINRDFSLLIHHPQQLFDDFKGILESNLNGAEILYFPTYRRVEEDLKNLEIDVDFENDFEFEVSGDSEIPIQFGMKDVKDRFEEIKSEVGRLSSKGLNTLSAEILRQLVRGKFDELPDVSEISKSDVKVVIGRIGNMFNEEDKRRILDIVESGKYPESDNLLVYFLSKLVEVYEEQKEIDLYTDKFILVCNKYLEQTQLIYDKSKVDIYVHSKKSKKEIQLNSLSSGEQQIVSLFSKIYLNSNKKFIVLFDEPELSLSIFWQMNLLPDIVDSEKCHLLVAVTHSPFIYDNSLRGCTQNLSDSITSLEEDCGSEE